MPGETEIRLCERCWKPIPQVRACLVGRHPHPAYPLLATPSTFRHLRGDPECTGSQRGGAEPATGTTH